MSLLCMELFLIAVEIHADQTPSSVDSMILPWAICHKNTGACWSTPTMRIVASMRATSQMMSLWWTMLTMGPGWTLLG